MKLLVKNIFPHYFSYITYYSQPLGRRYCRIHNVLMQVN